MGSILPDLFCFLYIAVDERNSPAISGNKGCCSHQAISHYRHPRLCTLRGVRMENNPGYWPQLVKVHIKGMISLSPDFCIFPYIEKCSIHQFEMSGFSLINTNLLMFQQHVSFLQKLFCILVPPLPLWSRPSELSVRVSPRLKPSVHLQNRT